MNQNFSSQKLLTCYSLLTMTGCGIIHSHLTEMRRYIFEEKENNVPTKVFFLSKPEIGNWSQPLNWLSQEKHCKLMDNKFPRKILQASKQASKHLFHAFNTLSEQMMRYCCIGKDLIAQTPFWDLCNHSSLLSFQMAAQDSALAMGDAPWIKMVGTVCVRWVGVGQAAMLLWKCFVETTWTMMEVSHC